MRIVLYASTWLAMAAGLLIAAPYGHRAEQVIAAGLGLLNWPLIEYVLHRFVQHGIKPFSTWHAAHHRNGATNHQPALVWSGVMPMLILVFAPAAMLAGQWPGAAFAFGTMTGYAGYVAIHHAIHHACCKHTWIRERKFRHALHHDPLRPAGYYGVTSSLWDKILGTEHRHDF